MIDKKSSPTQYMLTLQQDCTFCVIIKVLMDLNFDQLCIKIFIMKT